MTVRMDDEEIFGRARLPLTSRFATRLPTSVNSDFSASLLKSFALDLKNLNGTELFVVKIAPDDCHDVEDIFPKRVASRTCTRRFTISSTPAYRKLSIGTASFPTSATNSKASLRSARGGFDAKRLRCDFVVIPTPWKLPRKTKCVSPDKLIGR